MAELRLGAARDITFQGLPFSVLVPDIFTKTANRQNTLQGLDFFFQLPFLNADFVYEIGENDENGDSYTAVDRGFHQFERSYPELREGEVYQRHANGKHQPPLQAVQPGG